MAFDQQRLSLRARRGVERMDIKKMRIKPASLRMATLSKADLPQTEAEMRSTDREAVGTLMMWIAVMTRPDFSFVNHNIANFVR